MAGIEPAAPWQPSRGKWLSPLNITTPSQPVPSRSRCASLCGHSLRSVVMSGAPRRLRHARLRPACPGGISRGLTLARQPSFLMCASRGSESTNPRPPERVPFARLQPLARLPARARWAALSRPPPRGSPKHARCRARWSTQNLEPSNSARLAARTERTHAKVWHAEQGELSSALLRSHQRLGFGEVSRPSPSGSRCSAKP